MIKFDVDKPVKKFRGMSKEILTSVSNESSKITTEVYSQVLPKAPVWNDVLRHTVLTETVPFERITESRIRQTLRYDAFNPQTGFHYGLLRHEQTTSGEPFWAKKGMEESSPMIEKVIANAVKRGVHK